MLDEAHFTVGSFVAQRTDTRFSLALSPRPDFSRRLGIDCTAAASCLLPTARCYQLLAGLSFLWLDGERLARHTNKSTAPMHHGDLMASF